MSTPSCKRVTVSLCSELSLVSTATTRGSTRSPLSSLVAAASRTTFLFLSSASASGWPTSNVTTAAAPSGVAVGSVVSSAGSALPGGVDAASVGKVVSVGSALPVAGLITGCTTVGGGADLARRPVSASASRAAADFALALAGAASGGGTTASLPPASGGGTTAPSASGAGAAGVAAGAAGGGVAGGAATSAGGVAGGVPAGGASVGSAVSGAAAVAVASVGSAVSGPAGVAFASVGRPEASGTPVCCSSSAPAACCW